MDLQPCLIRPGLYLSSQRTEVYREILDQHGITHILQVGAELQPTHLSHYRYLQLPVCDVPEQDIIRCFSEAFQFIDSAIDAGGAVLVHCQAGISRSATVVIGYCMWKDKLSLDAAIQQVMQARSVIWPNPGFKCQLRRFEALSCDVNKWSGWNSQKYLSMQYGDESVIFMSHMLGSPAADSLIGAGCRTDPTRVLHRADMAAAGSGSNMPKSTHQLYCSAAAGSRISLASSTAEPHDEFSCDDTSASDNSCNGSSKASSKSGTSHSRNRRLKTDMCGTSNTAVLRSTAIAPGGGAGSSSSQHGPYDDATIASAVAAATASVASLGTSWLDKEAALMMAG